MPLVPEHLVLQVGCSRDYGHCGFRGVMRHLTHCEPELLPDSSHDVLELLLRLHFLNVNDGGVRFVGQLIEHGHISVLLRGRGFFDEAVTNRRFGTRLLHDYARAGNLAQSRSEAKAVEGGIWQGTLPIGARALAVTHVVVKRSRAHERGIAAGSRWVVTRHAVVKGSGARIRAIARGKVSAACSRQRRIIGLNHGEAFDDSLELFHLPRGRFLLLLSSLLNLIQHFCHQGI
mmetsp:Transcript_63704/g.136947  ORF Transcript_63704/g.136947 Transcript_63704/m.136947 type:complete len:232 (+) Transcript_63704:1455-2150(+)